MTGRSVVMLSGGWESTLCLIRAHRERSDVVALFVEYGQSYVAEERRAAAKLAGLVDVPLITEVMSDAPRAARGVFPDRNLRLLQRAASLGSEVWFGCRGPLAAFDRTYRDSNAQWALKVARELGVTVRMPCLLFPKWLVRHQVRSASFLMAEMVFSSEGLTC